MGEREDDIVATFACLSGGLASGQEVDQLLGQFADDCARLLDVNAVGLLLAARDRSLHVAATSSDRVAELEAFQAQRGEGPCHTCYLDGQPVNVPDLAAEAARWPDFARVAARSGVVSVHTVPMRLSDTVVGALNLFGTTPGHLNGADLRLAQALADVATVAIIQDRAASDTNTINEQLRNALHSRISVEQATGFLASVGDLDMPDAFGALRHYARDHCIKLAELAEALVNRGVPAAVVLHHARTRGT